MQQLAVFFRNSWQSLIACNETTCNNYLKLQVEQRFRRSKNLRNNMNKAPVFLTTGRMIDVFSNNGQFDG